MKKIVLTLFALLMVSFTIPTLASLDDCLELKGCARKHCLIELQKTYAQSHGNDRRAAGLDRALRNATQHCSDDALKEYQQYEIDQKEREIDHLQDELKAAEARPGAMTDPKKLKQIEKIEKKIDKAEDKLEKAEDKYARNWGSN